ncbi:VOC family protein [Ammoniphilus resinae]|nr:VOC family protein [Ammoniphilus resinae]
MTSQLTPFIWMDGEAKEALKFYEKTLEAKIVFKETFAKSPDPEKQKLPADFKERIAHAVLRVGDSQLFVADMIPDQASELEGSKTTICVTTSDAEKAKQFFEALQQGGQVMIPLNRTHYSSAYGVVKDKFGVTFHILTSRR